MWIDTHCHLDAGEFDGDRDDVVAAAERAAVTTIVVPAVDVRNFQTVRALARRHRGAVYALGIHPLYVERAADEDLDRVRQEAERALRDERFVAIGEIGLDFFVREIADGPARDRQERFYAEQLRIARDLGLPVLLHVRRAQDIILKHLRRIEVPGGIAHAFNGSDQQAAHFVERSFALGFGGAMTFTRARQIRHLAAHVPLASVVLETDAPDIAPAWLHPGRNVPAELPRIGESFAALRGMPADEVAEATSANARAVLPRLRALQAETHTA